MFSLSYPQCFNVSRVHPVVRALFPTNPNPELPLAGKIKLFHSDWAKLTQDLNTLNIVQGFEIPFLENPVLRKSPNPPVLKQEQSLSRRNSWKYCLKVQYCQYYHAEISISATYFCIPLKRNQGNMYGFHRKGHFMSSSVYVLV